MQKYFCQGWLETLKELNYKTCIIQKGGKKYIRVDNAVGKGIPGDWSYREYSSVFEPALDYAKELANIAEIPFHIYINLELLNYLIVPEPLSEKDKDHDIFWRIITVYPDDYWEV